jgi:hypothetical protein
VELRNVTVQVLLTRYIASMSGTLTIIARGSRFWGMGLKMLAGMWDMAAKMAANTAALASTPMSSDA